MTSFFVNQPVELREKYTHYLVEVGQLSRLFSDNEAPYIYYRAHENAFCEAFGAQNLARGDISFDAKKGKVAVGLKTFVNTSPQKIAEFNSESKNFRELKNLELAKYVSTLRNKRLDFARNLTDCDEMLYHIAFRENQRISLIEAPMDYVNVEKIRIVEDRDTTLRFSDGLNDYTFSKSKSTLLEKFDTREKIASFDVRILDDPFGFLDDKLFYKTAVREKTAIPTFAKPTEQIILPLYSSRTGEVEQKSGLNQWNAGGRKRDANEVYIPIPAEIREKVRKFFGESAKFDDDKSMRDSPKFEILLPNGHNLVSKIAQQGGKALMSEHNADLGKWLLRDVLHLSKGELVSRELLDSLGIDSVKLTKMGEGKFAMDFAKSGSYSEFVREIKP